jgi:tetratricopeptide repeat protein
VYPDPRVADFINERFVPVRLHVKDQHEDFQRIGGQFGAQWTPTILIVDDGGEERFRIEGFLPADDFLGQLMLGTARAAFDRKDYATAERLYREVVDRFPQTEAAAEALYWTGVAKYRATNDPSALNDTARAFQQRYQSTSWAKKASVWN